MEKAKAAAAMREKEQQMVQSFVTASEGVFNRAANAVSSTISDWQRQAAAARVEEQRRASELAKKRQQGIWSTNANGKTIFYPGVDEKGPAPPNWKPFNAVGHWGMSHDVLAGYWRYVFDQRLPEAR
jgi:hypothetical protein